MDSAIPSTGDFEGWLAASAAVGKAVLEDFSNPLVVHHYDCDGIASGSVVLNALMRAKTPHSSMMLKRVDAEGMARVAKIAAGEVEKPVAGCANAAASGVQETGRRDVVFVDLGSGQISMVEERLLSLGVKVAVIDHHVPQKPVESGRLLHANCMLHGFDGSLDACAASTAFYCFKDARWANAISGEGRDNWDLSRLAIVGAVGDMQTDVNGLRSLNGWVAAEAEKRGFLRMKRDLRMFGRVSRGLVDFLQYSTEPFLPGLTGSAKNCALFLADRGIPVQDGAGKPLHYNDLGTEEQRRLASALVNYAYSRKMEEEAVGEIVGVVFEFPSEERHSELFDASEFSTLLNACGRHGKIEVGVRVCLNEKGALEEAREVLKLHRMMISQGVFYARQHTIDLGPFYFLDARGKIEDTVVGTVIGNFFSSGILARTKPIIGFSIDEENGGVKASARAGKKLVEKGYDVNLVMRGAASAVGGLGGGHKTASGASFPLGKENDFLKKCKEVLEAQVRNFPPS
ncbi:DHH family phosphoesterase [Candidatus Micrarchaeota archaeon]|nr:DHH family phosphoesterase [Candidatus Micrarchaeota archaeon]